MTIQQLQYVLEINRTGSMSKAARNLYVSQPNISNAVKNLEKELGITIFERTTVGIRLTPSGRKLVQKATGIMADIEDIVSECQEEEVKSFRLVYPRYVPAFEAFSKMCARYQDRPMNFSCYIGYGEKQVEELYRNHCDLVVNLGSGNMTELKRLCADLHIEVVPVTKPMHWYVQLSEHHPLLQKGTFDLAELKNYPYVAFADLDDWNGKWMPWGEVVNPDRLICVQSTSARISMLDRTNAFSIVLPHSEEYNKAHGVVQIPFESTEPQQIVCLYSADRGLSDIGMEYVELLKEHLEFWNGF